MNGNSIMEIAIGFYVEALIFNNYSRQHISVLNQTVCCSLLADSMFLVFRSNNFMYSSFLCAVKFKTT